MPTHYHTLGLSTDATGDEVRQAYRKLAVKYHPDKNPDDAKAEERFKRVNNAYQVLSDPQRKAAYDLKIDYQKAQQAYSSYQRYSTPPPPTPGQRGWSPYGYRQKGKASPFTRNFSPKEERKSTYYAFAFIGVMAVITVLIYQINQKYLENQLIARQARKSDLVTMMKDFCVRGEVDSAVLVVEQMQAEGFIVGDDNSAHEQVMAQLYRLTEESFRNNEFSKAVFFGALVNERWDHKPARDLNLWLAKSHRELGQTSLALERLDSLMYYYPYDVMPYMEAARLVYEDRPEDALSYYRDAVEVMIDSYKARYGEGYMMVMGVDKVPSYHFELFLEIGKAHVEAGQYDIADNQLRWAIHLNRRNREGYKWLARCYTLQGVPQRGCSTILKAVNRGYLDANTPLLNDCQ